MRLFGRSIKWIIWINVLRFAHFSLNCRNNRINCSEFFGLIDSKKANDVTYYVTVKSLDISNHSANHIPIEWMAKREDNRKIDKIQNGQTNECDVALVWAIISILCTIIPWCIYTPYIGTWIAEKGHLWWKKNNARLLFFNQRQSSQIQKFM